MIYSTKLRLLSLSTNKKLIVNQKK